MGMLNSEAPNMRFINHALVPRSMRRLIRSPGKCRINHHGLQHSRGAVAAVKGQVFEPMTDPISEVRIAPFQVTDNLFSIGIKQQLVAVEAKSLGWIVRAVDAIAIRKPRPRLRQIAMPDLVGLLRNIYSMKLAPSGAIKDTQLHSLGMLREESKIHAFSI